MGDYDDIEDDLYGDMNGDGMEADLAHGINNSTADADVDIYGDVNAGTGQAPDPYSEATQAVASVSGQDQGDADPQAVGSARALAPQGAQQGAQAGASQYELPAVSGSVLISNLQWWTTDVELEAACAEYGSIVNVKFNEEKSNGKSKGSAVVEFTGDNEAPMRCRDGLNGRLINGKSVTVVVHRNAMVGYGPQGGAGGRGFGDGGQSGGRGRGAGPGRGGQGGGRGGMIPGMMPPGMMGMPHMGMPGMGHMMGMPGMGMGGMPGMPGMGFQPAPPPPPPPRKTAAPPPSGGDDRDAKRPKT